MKRQSKKAQPKQQTRKEREDGVVLKYCNGGRMVIFSQPLLNL